MDPVRIRWPNPEAGGWPGKGREGDTSPSQGRRDDGRGKMEGGRWKMEEGCRKPSKRLAHGTWAGGFMALALSPTPGWAFLVAGPVRSGSQQDTKNH